MLRPAAATIRQSWCGVLAAVLLASAGAAEEELSTISFSRIEFGPVTAGATHTTTVWYELEFTTVVAASDDGTPTISPADEDADREGHQITFVAGTKKTITVTVPDGDDADSDDTTYTFEVTRLGASVAYPRGTDQLWLRPASSYRTYMGVGEYMQHGRLDPPYQGALAIAVERDCVQDETRIPRCHVCDDWWDQPDAQVACRQLGLGGGQALRRVNLEWEYMGYLLDDVKCDGSENNILECPSIRQPNVRGCYGRHEGAGVICDPPSPDNANLAELHLTGVEMTGNRFSAAVTDYAGVAVLPSGESTVRTTVWARATHAGAAVAFDPVADADTNAEGHQVDLVDGDQVVATVTAEDGMTTRAYTVDVSLREALREVSSDATLGWLRLAGDDVAGFAPETSSYSVSFGNERTSVHVSARAADEEATVTVDGHGGSGRAYARTVQLSVGVNTVRVTVTAEDGTERTYTLTVNRAESSEARLSSLSLSGVDFGTFSRHISTYSGRAADDLASTIVAAEAVHEEATVSILGGPFSSGVVSRQVSLSEGVTVVTILVRAQDQSTRTYTVRVVRGSGPVLESVRVDGDRLTLTYDESLDEASVPSREDFSVLVDGTEVDVVAVSISDSTVTLQLASAPPHGAVVAVDYWLGADPIQAESGGAAAPFAGEVAAEVLVSVSSASALEGEPVEFEVVLSRTVASGVSVEWSLLAGSATPGQDYDAGSGVVEVEAGAVAAVISVLTLDDEVSEPEETFTVQLSEPQDFPHWAMLSGREAVGRIADDDSSGIGSGGAGGAGGGSPPPSDGDAGDEEDDDSGGGGGASGPLRAAIGVSLDCDEQPCRSRTGMAVTFTDESSGDVRSRTWDFGDGGISRRSSQVHSWSAPGFYTVTLIVREAVQEARASLVFLVTASDPAGTCEPDGETLCLLDSRYAVTVGSWELNGAPSPAHVVHAGTNDSGLFHFFGADNWEILVKVLDGCSTNGHVWVFGASATDLGYAIRVTDTVTGDVREYEHAPGAPAPAITDVTAFTRGCRP